MFWRLNLCLTAGQARTPEALCMGHITDKISFQGYQSLQHPFSWCLSCSISYFKNFNSYFQESRWHRLLPFWVNRRRLHAHIAVVAPTQHAPGRCMAWTHSKRILRDLRAYPVLPFPSSVYQFTYSVPNREGLTLRISPHVPQFNSLSSPSIFTLHPCSPPPPKENKN